MNQEVIYEHLARVGLQTVAAENGKIGVELVKQRKQNNEKPFDLTFMDMFMPAMAGMEAASKIMALDTGTPIVAMTANIMTSEIDKYKQHGMLDCLGKPFTSQELWGVLLKYLTPKSRDPVNELEDNKELKRKLQINFVKNNQNIFTEITEAVEAEDIKLAHKLGHSLKGNAGMIGKTDLRNAAADVETLLRGGDNSTWDDKMFILKSELNFVLEGLMPLLDESAKNDKSELLEKEQVLALFEKLAVMLENINPECINLLDELKSVSGTEELVLQMEDYDFEAAVKVLDELKKKWE
jgi:CheY-like chemotaxis protein